MPFQPQLKNNEAMDTTSRLPISLRIVAATTALLAFHTSITYSLHQPFVRQDIRTTSRRAALSILAGPTTITAFSVSSAAAATPNGLPLTSTTSGLKWADAKVGSGQAVMKGTVVSIDYSMASTAGRFPQIYTTKDKGSPYRWKLGDGSTISGIEVAITGDNEIPPMLPGGVRRVIIPANLGYQQLAVQNAKCSPDDGAIGPIPPKDGSGAYQRWSQFYCNPRIPYQPDLVVDIKLYGKRN